jgi:hypothetical protein
MEYFENRQEPQHRRISQARQEPLSRAAREAVIPRWPEGEFQPKRQS